VEASPGVFFFSRERHPPDVFLFAVWCSNLGLTRIYPRARMYQQTCLKQSFSQEKQSL
jgi:hypothetical protein